MRIFSLLAIFCFCHSVLSAAEPQAATYEFNFKNGAQDWSAGFADYPVGSEKFYELKQRIKRLPSGLAHRNKAYFISGNNHSDDLCMYLQRQIAGLQPDTTYLVAFIVTFASNASKTDAGVGGAPGSGVSVKAGATLQRPALVIENGYYWLNIDKGNQGLGGADALKIGNVGVETSDHRYRLKTLKNSARPFLFKTDSAGTAWLFVCTDSGFEATTSLYFTRITAQFLPQD